MVDKVEINQEQENNPTLEEQAKQQEEKQEAPQQVTSNEERPSWLPDKFSNAEELAKAYGALETKLSQRQEVKQEEKTDIKIQEPQEPESKPGQFDKYYDEFAKEGKLTETSYGELQKLGLDRQVVDAYIDGGKNSSSLFSAANCSPVSPYIDEVEAIINLGISLSFTCSAKFVVPSVLSIKYLSGSLKLCLTPARAPK